MLPNLHIVEALALGQSPLQQKKKKRRNSGPFYLNPIFVKMITKVGLFVDCIYNSVIRLI